MSANRKKDDAAVSKNDDRDLTQGFEDLKILIKALNEQIKALNQKIDFMLARNFLGSNDLIMFVPYTVGVTDIERIHWDNLVREKNAGCVQSGLRLDF